MKPLIKKLLILFSIILIILIAFIFSIVYSFINYVPEPYGDIEYKVAIETDGNATLYLPLPLDLPNGTVSDLVSTLEVSEKSADTQVSYNVINTTYGKALCVVTTGNVVLSAHAGYEYFETHPDVPVHPFIPGQEEPMFFDLSLQKKPTNKLNYERWAYLGTDNNSSIDIKVFERIITSYKYFGTESWKSLEDNSSYYGYFTLKPGWQIIEFDHGIGYA